ncbi:hypothetical protein [Desulfolutivibrio sp.]|uniref:hypothetical protein n=1 Tax=Desulfolutivibrio sp. TaxID=2773296 RepID=UPI002F965664
MEDQGSSGTVEVFLATLGESLEGKDDVDKELVKILKEHILKVSPAQDVVVQAMKDILALATNRVESIIEERTTHE